MSSLFDSSERENRWKALPLAARMRPRRLSEFVGQEHFLGEGKLLRRLLKANRLGSTIFYGPPGVGKTTLAYLLAKESRCVFRQLSAVSDGVKPLRETLTQAKDRLSASGARTLLFIDEIHRFNKSQQDVLLPDVEQGVVVLVGATTENPFFAVNNALLSRSRVFQFEPLSESDIKTVVRRAATDRERGLGAFPIELKEDALDYLAAICDGDARRALSTLEIAVLSSLPSEDAQVECSKQNEQNEQGAQNKESTPVPTIVFTKELAADSVQRRAVSYDRDGDEHYNGISALIKSIRGSDPDASIYWLAKALEGGEDVRFLARRLVILASEDVGNADPNALPLAVATSTACERVGLPECRLNLAQTVAYLACAPKSNATTEALFAALDDVRNQRILPVPRILRDAHFKGAESLGHVGYQYAHNAPDAVAAQDYLGVDREYYRPTERGAEKEIGERLAKIRAILRSAKPNAAPGAPDVPIPRTTSAKNDEKRPRNERSVDAGNAE